MNKPVWWNWELELTPHIEKRMFQRGLSEIELRVMLEKASEFKEDKEDGRYVIFCTESGMRWEVIVEPDYDEHLLVLITAYRLWE